MEKKYYLVILSGILLALFFSREASAAATLTYMISDGTGLGFTRAEVDKRGRGIFFSTAGGAPYLNRSVRSFDGVQFETLWPDGEGGVHNRHNGTLLYVPALDELWITGGSHMEIIDNALRSGRFYVGEKRWITTSTSDQGAFAGVIKGGFYFQPNQAAAWSSGCNTGMVFGGSGNAIFDANYLIEPNPGGPEPYKLTEVTGYRPPARSQAQNLMVAVGCDFYLVGGYAGSINNAWTFNKDFWKFSLATRQWTRLIDPPMDGYQCSVTYDQGVNKIVHWCNNTLMTFNLNTGVWADETPPGLPSAGNMVAVYLPNLQINYFQGGTLWANGGTQNYSGYGIKLSGTQAPPPAPQPPPPPPPPPSPAPVPTPTSSASGVIAVPFQHFIPDPPCSTGGCKHFRVAQDKATGKIYFMGGDDSRRIYNEAGTIVSGDGGFLNGVWSYDPKINKWTDEYPYCGKTGDIMPGRPDEVGWIYRPVDGKFYIFPGFYGLSQSGQGICGGFSNRATQGLGIYAFDPVLKKWERPDIPNEPINPGVEHSKNGVYDPVRDSVIRVRYDGGGGIIWSEYFFKQKRWEEFYTPHSIDGTYINNAHLDKEYIDIDPVGRHIYVIDPNFYRLFRLNIETRQIEILAPIPVVDAGKPGTLQDITMVVWDSKRKILIYPYNRDNAALETTLLIYHPSGNRWEIGPKVRANTALYDSVNDYVFLLGGLDAQGGNDPTLNSFYLYRYDGATGTVPPPPPPPSPSLIPAPIPTPTPSPIPPPSPVPVPVPPELPEPAPAPMPGQRTLTEPQIQSIISLLQSFGAELRIINNVEASLRGQAPSMPTPAPIPPSLPTLTGPFGVGIRSNQVKILQRILGVNQTGYYGNLTKQAVANFQKKYGIFPTGIAGPVTRAKLNEIYAR